MKHRFPGRFLAGGLASLVLLISCSLPTGPRRTVAVSQDPLSEAWIYLDILFYYHERMPADPSQFPDIGSLVSSLNDPYTQYWPPEYTDLVLKAYTSTAGKGYGLRLYKMDSTLRIWSVVPGSPAQRAGLLSDDKLLQVNSISLVNIPQDSAYSILGRQDTSPVLFSVRRQDSLFSVNIGKDTFHVPTVEARNSVFGTALWPGLEYVHIYEYMTDQENPKGTYDELRALYPAVSESSSIILDLRGNGGGVLSEASRVVDFFLSAGQMFTVIERMDYGLYDTTSDSAKAGEAGERGKIFLLVDHGTASAAELHADALIQNGRAVAFGDTTFGKQVGQVLITLSNGGLLKVTNLRLYGPGGDDYNLKGIVPDSLWPATPGVEPDAVLRRLVNQISAGNQKDTLPLSKRADLEPVFQRIEDANRRLTRTIIN
jgi:carboxyl-terminal processing protease